MKVKKLQIWRKVDYGDERKFKFWSSKVKGKGDETLAKDSSLKDWKKVIVLKPIGNLKTRFSMGFSSIFGETKVSSAIRRVEDESFGMRMGPEDCDFFIVSNEGEVGLEFVEYADIDDKTKSELPLY